MKNAIRPLLITGILLCFHAITFAQQKSFLYSSAPAGLNIRALPDEKAAVLTKIVYAGKVEDRSSEDTLSWKRVVVGGIPANWKRIKYKDTVGYVIDAYLSSIAPPKTGTKDFESYLKQITVPFGNKLVQEKEFSNITESGLAVSRQLYRNGMVYSVFTGYEYHAESLQIPAESVATVYNIVRNIEELAPILKSGGDLKEGAYTSKGPNGEEITWKVVYQKENDFRWLSSINISWGDGGFYVINIQLAESEVIVTYSSAV